MDSLFLALPGVLSNLPKVAAIVLFGAATLWINYEVKVNMRAAGGGGSTEEMGNIKVGMPAPDFSSVDLSGAAVNLADYRGGKFVVVDFWATWCGPCRMAMPGLQKLQDDFQSRGLEVLSVNQGEPAELVGDFIKKKGYRFHVLLDQQSAVGALYGVRGIPTMVLVDKKGIVRWIRVGYSPDESELSEMLEQVAKE